jgi:alpha-D-ribose 1-methylphosphonate 5-triphosphate synthase subunit PhnI
MAYVAVKGGRAAIENACRLLARERIKGNTPLLRTDQIREQLYLLVDRVMSEGALYAPELAALAVKQSAGDTLEAAFMVRAFRTTLPRIGYSLPRTTGEMRVIRRISAAFKDVPGGQVLGPTSDYSLRLLDFDLFEETEADRKRFRRELEAVLPEAAPWPPFFPKIVGILQQEGLLSPSSPAKDAPNPRETLVDLTRESLTFPAPRSAVLQALARSETGGVLAFAYSSMRGYGNVHPTIGELRVGYAPLAFRHPQTGRPYVLGEVKVTEAEIVARFNDPEGKPMFRLGYGLCFGQNEIKAISMAVLDRTLQADSPRSPAEDPEFVLSHVDGIEAMGFCHHWKLPHYVDFQSDLDRLRKAQRIYATQKMAEPQRQEKEKDRSI